eukprot:TRINITY_DN2999_c0_g1_i2.p1 TRINITY_DN2999_c0_g1~~TRINITY_DN2999_c0_g1_i2.p1  ORF type:complete len:228 (-),score=35.20 TRINITY_DN2999_c0_g1_i2:97-780(-)
MAGTAAAAGPPLPSRRRSYDAVVATSRLVGVVIGPAHAPALVHLFNDESTARFMDDPEEKRTVESVSEQYKNPHEDHDLCLVFFHRASVQRPGGGYGGLDGDGVVGYGSVYEWATKHACQAAEISFIVDPTARGCGYGREIIGALCEIAFSLNGPFRVSKLIADVVTENQASARGMAALGFKQHGFRPKAHKYKNVLYDVADLVCTKEDWQTKRDPATTVLFQGDGY